MKKPKPRKPRRLRARPLLVAAVVAAAGMTACNEPQVFANPKTPPDLSGVHEDMGDHGD